MVYAVLRSDALLKLFILNIKSCKIQTRIKELLTSVKKFVADGLSRLVLQLTRPGEPSVPQTNFNPTDPDINVEFHYIHKIICSLPVLRESTR